MFAAFESPKLLVKRAKGHLADFKSTERFFVTKKPYEFIKKIDPKAGEIRLIAKVTREFPKNLSVIAFDIINCLRSALDHAVFDASAALGDNPKPKYTKFPFGKTAGDAASDTTRKGAGVPVVLHPYLLGFEPYKGGNKSLYELNELRNNKIHTMLSAVFLKSEAPQIGAAPGTIGTIGPGWMDVCPKRLFGNSCGSVLKVIHAMNVDIRKSWANGPDREENEALPE